MNNGFTERSAMLLGNEGIDLLGKSNIIVFGLGGVGSYTAEALARAGVGKLTLVDNDVVSVSNINRQLYALNSTVGKLKTEVAAERIKDINPGCVVTVINKFCLPENLDEIDLTEYEYVADCIDTVSAKIGLAEKAYRMNIPIISCMGTGNKLHPERFRISDINKTQVCPLCRVMRRELKQRGIPSLKVLWSDEQPIKSEGNERVDGKSTPGSVSFTPPVAGMLIAGEIIREIAGCNE